MDSNFKRQKSVMNTLSKPKHYSEQNKNTWGNLLQKKTVCTSTKTSDSKKQRNRGVQCVSTISEGCQSSNSLSIFNPVRTLQFLLKEISHLPKSQNPDLISIVQDMQIVVERIVDEYSELTNPISNKISDLSMIPTKGDKCLENSNDKNNDRNDLTLINKITRLENNNALLTEQLKLTEEKLRIATSEKDAIIRELKDNSDTIAKLNKREREYLDTIYGLKTKLISMEKTTNSHEVANKELIKRLMTVSKVSENTKKSSFEELKEDDLMVLPKENKAKKTKLPQDLTSQEWSRTYYEPEQFMFNNENTKNLTNKIKNTDVTSSSNILHQFDKQSEEKYIELQCYKHNQKIKDFTSKKCDLENIFKNFKVNLSTKGFQETKLGDISDEDDNFSDTSHVPSVKTNSVLF